MPFAPPGTVSVGPELPRHLVNIWCYYAKKGVEGGPLGASCLLHVGTHDAMPAGFDDKHMEDLEAVGLFFCSGILQTSVKCLLTSKLGRGG